MKSPYSKARFNKIISKLSDECYDVVGTIDHRLSVESGYKELRKGIGLVYKRLMQLSTEFPDDKTIKEWTEE